MATSNPNPNYEDKSTSKIENFGFQNMFLSKTHRNDSARSRPSQERVGGETRNSSRSSGAANCSGNRKRKFSKIVFEISELPP